MILLALACLLTGCGYGFTKHQQITDLPDDLHSLFFEALDNPTLDPDLNLELRQRVRDEITSRGLLTWDSRETADGLLTLRVVRFTSNTTVTGEDDETIKSAATLRLEAWITRRRDGANVWNSGNISESQSFFGGGQGRAETTVIDLAARRLADRLASDF